MTHEGRTSVVAERSGQTLESFAPSIGGITSSSTPLPSRRRNVKTPLHTVHRTRLERIDVVVDQPYFALGPAQSSPLRRGNAQDIAAPSAFVSPNSLSRKRSHYTAVASSSSAPMLAGSRSSTMAPALPSSTHAYSRASTAISHVDAPDLDSDASWYLGNHDSPSTSRTGSTANGSWSRKQHHQFHTRYSEPQTSHPARPTRGEFSFQAPSASQVGSSSRPVVDYHDESLTDMPESSSSAFARLAQAQRQQQEARRMAASGANTTMDDYVEGPAAKKRRSVAGTLMDGALNAALYTGAAAFTAYSLWSKWGKKDGDEDEDGGHNEEGRSQNDKLVEAQHLPPGGLEEPPPPYIERSSGSLASSSSRMHRTVNSPANRAVHVFVSSRRRRPVFATHRSTNTPKRRSAMPDFLSDTSTTSTPSMATRLLEQDRTMSSFSTDTSNTTLDEDSDEDDEMFKRFQAKMSSLIEEGTKALNSKVDLSEMDLGEDEQDCSTMSASILSPSTSQAVQSDRKFAFQSRDPYVTPPMHTIDLPQSQSAAHMPDSPRIGLHASSIPLLVNRHADSPRATYLTLAGRDVNSPYGRLAHRPTPTSASSTPRQPF